MKSWIGLSDFTFTFNFHALEKEMATHSNVLIWRIPGTEEPVGLCPLWGRTESDTTKRLHFHFSVSCTGGGNGNPLQCSCLVNPRDGGAWWAAVYGVAESDTTERLRFHFSLSGIGEGNGNPLQCSYLENPRDRGAWRAAICGVTRSRT